MARPAQSIGDRVRLRRLALGWTQEQLAQRASVTVSTVRNIERGRTERSYRLGDILTALGLEESEEARIRRLLIEAGIPQQHAETAARIIAAEQAPPPPPGQSRPA